VSKANIMKCFSYKISFSLSLLILSGCANKSNIPIKTQPSGMVDFYSNLPAGEFVNKIINASNHCKRLFPMESSPLGGVDIQYNLYQFIIPMNAPLSLQGSYSVWSTRNGTHIFFYGPLSGMFIEKYENPNEHARIYFDSIIKKYENNQC
jgi:hypothetical protein